jgi:hypothetical protein
MVSFTSPAASPVAAPPHPLDGVAFTDAASRALDGTGFAVVRGRGDAAPFPEHAVTARATSASAVHAVLLMTAVASEGVAARG